MTWERFPPRYCTFVKGIDRSLVVPFTEWQVMRKFGHFHLINYNKLLNKRSRAQRFETPWRSCNAREEAALFISPVHCLFCRILESHLYSISVIAVQPGWQLLNKDKLNRSTLFRKSWKSKKIAYGKIDSGQYWPFRKMIWHISRDLLSHITRWNGQIIITASIVSYTPKMHCNEVGFYSGNNSFSFGYWVFF